jgi:hypothetical protein
MIEPANGTAPGQPVAFRFSNRSYRAALHLSRFLSILTILLGVGVLAGWALHIESLKTVLPNYVSMKPNTALCFALSGTALLLGFLFHPQAWKRNCAFTLCGGVVLIGGTTLIE